MSPLGKIFRKKLDQREFEFKESYWKELEKELDLHSPKASPNFSKLFFTSVGAAISITVAVWFFSPVRKIQQLNPQSSEVVEIPAKDNNRPESKINQLSSEGTEVNNNSENALPVAKSGPSATIQNSVNALPTEKFSENNPEQKPLKTALTGSSQRLDKNAEKKEELTLHEISPQDKTEAASSANFLPPTVHPESISNDHRASSSGKAFMADAKIPVQDELLNKPANADKFFEPGNSEAAPVESKLLENTEVQSSLIFMQKIFPPHLSNSHQNELNAISKKSNSHKKRHYFAGVYSGLMYTDKILKSKDALLNEYISRRKNEENSMISANLGMDAGIYLNRWSISAGINYHQQGEHADYKPEFYQWIKNTSSTWNITDNSFYETDTTNTVAYLISDGTWQDVNTEVIFWNSTEQAWDTQMVAKPQYVVTNIDTGYVYNIETNYIEDIDSLEIQKTDSSRNLVNDPSLKTEQLTTRINYIEFPLLVGYEFPFGRMTLMLKTGLSMGLLTKINARYMKNDISGTEEIDAARVKKTMLNYLFHMGVNYYLTEKLALNIDPMFRMNMNSVLKNSGYGQRYWNAGLNVGMMYRF